MEYKGECVIIQHCAVLGRRETQARWVKTDKTTNSTVTIFFKQAGEAQSVYYIVRSDNIRFAQISVEGQIVWDSRREVPCNMAFWEALHARNQDRSFDAV
jgi:hypothetical protein